MSCYFQQANSLKNGKILILTKNVLDVDSFSLSLPLGCVRERCPINNNARVDENVLEALKKGYYTIMVKMKDI